MVREDSKEMTKAKETIMKTFYLTK